VGEIDAAISGFTSVRTIDEVLAALDRADVPCGKIYSVADMVDDAQFAARGMFEVHPLEDGTPVKFPGIVPKLSETPGKTRWMGPRLGEHTAEVLEGLGFSEEERDELRKNGVI
jgi:formyl-CoA transferase